jgi:hypothetical protein
MATCLIHCTTGAFLCRPIGQFDQGLLPNTGTYGSVAQLISSPTKIAIRPAWIDRMLCRKNPKERWAANFRILWFLLLSLSGKCCHVFDLYLFFIFLYDFFRGDEK